MSKWAYLYQVARRNAQRDLPVMWNYMKVELRPPTQAEIPQIQKGFTNLVQGFKTKKWRELSVKECWLNTLISLEIAMWFFAGEVVGRGSLFGYYIPANVYSHR